jgi:hypothetical protein
MLFVLLSASAGGSRELSALRAKAIFSCFLTEKG